MFLQWFPHQYSRDNWDNYSTYLNISFTAVRVRFAEGGEWYLQGSKCQVSVTYYNGDDVRSRGNSRKGQLTCQCLSPAQLEVLPLV